MITVDGFKCKIAAQGEWLGSRIELEKDFHGPTNLNATILIEITEELLLKKKNHTKLNMAPVPSKDILKAVEKLDNVSITNHNNTKTALVKSKGFHSHIHGSPSGKTLSSGTKESTYILSPTGPTAHATGETPSYPQPLSPPPQPASVRRHRYSDYDENEGDDAEWGGGGEVSGHRTRAVTDSSPRSQQQGDYNSDRYNQGADAHLTSGIPKLSYSHTHSTNGTHGHNAVLPSTIAHQNPNARRENNDVLPPSTIEELKMIQELTYEEMYLGDELERKKLDMERRLIEKVPYSILSFPSQVLTILNGGVSHTLHT